MMKQKNYANFSDMVHMLENMNGLELYRLMIDMPGSSGFLHDLDRFLMRLAEVKIEAGTLGTKYHTRMDEPEIAERIEEKTKTLEEQRIKFLAVDEGQRKKEQLAALAEANNMTEEEIEDFLVKNEQWQ